MNKVVAVLGIIVLLTLAMLFFCIGFFTGSTVTPGTLTEAISSEIKKDKNENMSKEAIAQKLGDLGDVKSAKISDKIMGILAAAGYTVENFSEIIKSKTPSIKKSSNKKKLSDVGHLSADSLLREMAISHSPKDDCSYEKTMKEIQDQSPVTEQPLQGKKVVFIGYFKNAIAGQIQKLLTGKGYKTHVEMSNDGHESFVFCGPFKRDETANKLLQWLQAHDFAEARVVSISKEAIEETLYDAMNDGTGLPSNEENEPTPSTTTNTTVGGAQNIGTSTGIASTGNIIGAGTTNTVGNTAGTTTAVSTTTPISTVPSATTANPAVTQPAATIPATQAASTLSPAAITLPTTPTVNAVTNFNPAMPTSNR